VDQACNVRETAAFARRVVCRALTVLGGAAAATALAWFLSSTAASAEPDSLAPVGDPVVGEVVQPVSDTVDELATRLLDSPQPQRDPIKAVGEKLRNAADRFDGRPAEHVAHIDVLPEVELPADLDLGRLEVETSSPPVIAPEPPTGAITGPGVDPEHTAESTATGRAYSSGMPSRGSPAPALPDLPTWPAPFAPVPPTAPAPGHAGQAGGNSAGSLISAALPWLDRAARPVRGLTVPATDASAFGRVGGQPGVIPD
jgi:hypothetical protein